MHAKVLGVGKGVLFREVSSFQGCPNPCRGGSTVSNNTLHYVHIVCTNYCVCVSELYSLTEWQDKCTAVAMATGRTGQFLSLWPLRRERSALRRPKRQRWALFRPISHTRNNDEISHVVFKREITWNKEYHMLYIDNPVS